LSIDVLHQQSLYGSIYSFPDVRLAVYQLLISLTLNPHFKFHSPLRYVIAILSKGLSDEHPKVLEVVRSGLLGIESVFTSYLTDTEVEKVMNEVVKFPSQVRSNQLEDVVQNVISSTSDPNVDEEMMDQSYEVEVSQPSLSKPQETNPDILKKVSEMEEILKASKAKNSDEDLIQTFYNQEKSPIVIPEDTLEKFYERDRQKASSHPPESKKPKLLTEENKLQEVDSEDGLDLNEMLSTLFTSQTWNP
ncbi:Proline_ glutamic acid and leucinerich protein 1-like, partial [Caligus rogercresseyi]